ncbi:hypothetical protein ACSBR1_013433 [Camellia fascicularis]
MSLYLFKRGISWFILLTVEKEESVRTVSERKEVEGNWVFNFRRRLYQWKECEVFHLRDLLVSAPSLVVDQVDKPVWAAESSGIFSVSSIFKRARAYADPRLRISKLCFNFMCVQQNWALPGSVEGIIFWWDGECFSSKERKIWQGVPLVVLWSLRKLRNDVVFNASTPILVELCEVIKVRFAVWLKPLSTEHNFTVQDFVFNLRQVRRCISGR